MPNYRAMYFYLFNAMTDALEALENKNISTAMEIIREAQCETEELYMEDK